MDQNIFNNYFKKLGINEIIKFIESAQEKIILAIPSLEIDLVNAIVAKDIKNIHILISKNDILGNRTSSHFKSLKKLLNRNITVRYDENSAIGVLVSDNTVLVFTPLNHGDVGINAYKPSTEEAKQITLMIQAQIVPNIVLENSKPEIGKNVITAKDVEVVEKEAKQLKQLESFKTIQKLNMVFIELVVKGINVKNKTITIPKELITDTGKSVELNKILESKAHIITNKEKVSKYSAEIDTLVRKLRNDYIVSIKGGYGSILNTNLQESFDKDLESTQLKIDKLYEKLKDTLKSEQTKTVKTLTNYFFKTLKKDPPKSFLKFQSLFEENDENLKKWIEEKLNITIGNAFDDSITIKVIYKNLSERLLEDQGFINELHNAKLLDKDTL
ncbi:MAG: hypothetical protein QM497_07120 [Sulfurimonas sp.]